ncbi:MAG: hypothetical protein AAFR46_20060 [Pseudomonadota bacterium]
MAQRVQGGQGGPGGPERLEKQGGRPGGALSPLLALAVLVLLGLVFLAAPRQQSLQTGATGFDGPGRWLTHEGLETRSFEGGWAIDAASVGLTIIPLYETALDQPLRPAQDSAAMLAQLDERDHTRAVILDKIEHTNSLIILPKWRQGMRLTGLAHPVLITQETRISATLRAILGPEAGSVRRLAEPFTAFDYVTHRGQHWSAQHYAAQVFEGQGCLPVLGQEGHMMLGVCRLGGQPDGHRVAVLSDPDLLNNNGLRLGDNAWIAQDIIANLAGERLVYVDYSAENCFVTPRQGLAYARSWSHLARFFGPPFLQLWLIAALVLGLTLWRAACRFSPPTAERRGQEASRAHIIAVQARLLRLTRQDGAMLAAYVPARLSAVARALFGPAHSAQRSDEALLLRHAQRQYAAQAEALAGLVTQGRTLPAALTAQAALVYFDALEESLEQLTDDA